jgi:DNA repair protein RadC
VNACISGRRPASAKLARIGTSGLGDNELLALVLEHARGQGQSAR